jgi:hypothetical protein
MSIPISTIVNVTVSMPPAYPSGTGFTTLLVLGQSPNLPLGVRARAFSSVQAVGQQFSSTSEEYKASLSFFSQNPRPTAMVIGRRVSAPAGGELLGSGNYEPDIKKWQAMPLVSILNLTVDGTPLSVTNMDFSQCANLNAVAAVAEEALLNPVRGVATLAMPMDAGTDTTVALNNAKPAQAGDTLKIDDELMTVMDATDPNNLIVTRAAMGSTAAAHVVNTPVYIGVSGVMSPSFVFTGNAFYCQSSSTGPSSGVFVTSPTTLSAMFGFEEGAISSPGIAAEESVDAALDACSAAISFYGVVLTRDFTDTEAMEAAEWVEANTKLFGHASGDQNMRSPTATTDFASVAKGKAYSRTCDAYNDPQGLGDYLMVSALARELAVDFSQPDSTITMCFKTCPGVTPSNLNTNDKTVLDSKNANYYAFFGAAPMFATGITANGGWVDQRHGLDYLGQHLADAAFSGLYAAPKIPQTERGMAYLTGLLDVAMQDMVNCGLIAPGTWKGTGIAGVVNTGDFLSKGYKIVAGKIADQSEADRVARKAPPITIACKGAGAIQHVDIYVQFEQ